MTPNEKYETGREHSYERNNQDIVNQSNRRGFLKAGTAIGASLIAAPGFGNTTSGGAPTTQHPAAGSDKITKRRTLGSGKYSMVVSALGLGCMGMSYHRGRIPDRKVSIALVRKAVELGV